MSFWRALWRRLFPDDAVSQAWIRDGIGRRGKGWL